MGRLDGRIDVLINNAGVFEAVPVGAPLNDWQAAWSRTLQINLQAAADLSRRAILHWQEGGASGRLVNIASRAAYRGDSPAHWHYAASKAGMVAMTKSIARGYAAEGILAFAVWLPWLPASGFPGWQAGAWAAIKSLILPAVALALPQGAILARVTRAAVLDTLGEDFVRTARAKGLSRRAALWRHAVPNALIPVVTLLGLQFSFLLAGTVIIENVFTLPGLGRLVFQAITQRDLIVVQDLVVLLAGAVILVNFAVDLAAAWIDPRLRGAA